MSYGFTRENLIKLHFGDNLTTTEIARIYNCNRDTVRLAMKRFGIVPRGKIHKPISEDLKNNLTVLYVEQRLSTREIGRVLGYSHDFVSDKLKELGIDVEDRITSLQGERNPCWKGGRSVSEGYIRISSNKISQKLKREHQVVMENYIGRELRKGECVHHIDGDRTNNNINNLALMDVSAHARLHALERWKEKKGEKNYV